MNGNTGSRRVLLLALVVGCSGMVCDPVQAQWSMYGSVDPYQYARPVGATPTVSTTSTWQTDPFNVGYNLLSGYRPLYSGAAQPIGHEIIETHGGNGYVYRPVYGAQPFYAPQHFGSYGLVVNHGSMGRALVIENPGTPYESRRSSSSAYSGHAAMIDVMPDYAAAPKYQPYFQDDATQAMYESAIPAVSPVAPTPPEVPAPAPAKREREF